MWCVGVWVDVFVAYGLQTGQTAPENLWSNPVLSNGEMFMFVCVCVCGWVCGCVQWHMGCKAVSYRAPEKLKCNHIFGQYSVILQ